MLMFLCKIILYPSTDALTFGKSLRANAAASKNIGVKVSFTFSRLKNSFLTLFL